MQYCFTKAGSSLVIKAEQRSNISRAQNCHSEMAWIYCSSSWGLSLKTRWILNYERKRMDRSELLKTTVSNPRFSQNLKPLLYCETVAFIIPLRCAGLAEIAESWQQIYVVTQPWKYPLLSFIASQKTFHISNVHTESSQKATGLVKGEWQFLSENFYGSINTFMLEFLKLWETRRWGAEDFLEKVVSKCPSLSARSQWNSQAANMFILRCSTEKLINPCLPSYETHGSHAKATMLW